MIFQLHLNWSLASLGGYSTSLVAFLVIKLEVALVLSSRQVKPILVDLSLISPAV